MIKTGGASVGSSRRPNIYTDSEVDQTVKKHDLFPKLTQVKQQKERSIRASLKGDSQPSPAELT